MEARGRVERARDFKAALLSGALLPEWDIEIGDEPSAGEIRDATEKSLPAEASKALREMRESEAATSSGAAVGAPAAAVESTEEPSSIDDLSAADLSDATGSRNVIDPVLTTFLARVDIAPTQVLRYCRWPAGKEAPVSAAAGKGDDDGDEDEEDDNSRIGALWFSKNFQPAASDIPPCGRCGAPRAFELQIMPQALHYLLPGGPAPVTAESDAAVSLDFGTMALFSCTATCAGEGYAEECVWVQPAAEKSAAERAAMEKAIFQGQSDDAAMPPTET